MSNKNTACEVLSKLVVLLLTHFVKTNCTRDNTNIVAIFEASAVHTVAARLGKGV